MRVPLRLGETLLGRSPYCSVVLADSSVSREHAAIRASAEGLVIQDLGSRNGTRVNGERLNGSRELKPGDRIELGNQQIRIEAKARTLRRDHPLASTGEYIAPEEEETPTAPRLVANPLAADGRSARSPKG